MLEVNLPKGRNKKSGGSPGEEPPLVESVTQLDFNFLSVFLDKTLKKMGGPG